MADKPVSTDICHFKSQWSNSHPPSLSAPMISLWHLAVNPVNCLIISVTRNGIVAPVNAFA